MQNFTHRKSRLAASKFVPPVPEIDLTLADTGTIESGSTYVGRIVSARLINPVAQGERTAKIDISFELIDAEGGRIGVLHDYLYLSARSMRRLKEFLMCAGIVDESNYREYKLNVSAFMGKLVGIVTKESETMTQDDGSPLIEVAAFLDPTEAAEQHAAEQGSAKK